MGRQIHVPGKEIKNNKTSNDIWNWNSYTANKTNIKGGWDEYPDILKCNSKL